MRNLKSTDNKLDFIIDSIQEIKEMRKDVITLVEWKNNTNHKLDVLESKPHECLKLADISSLTTSIKSINKFKWWFLGVLIMVISTTITFSVDLSKEYASNKSDVIINRNNIKKINQNVERLFTVKRGG